MLDAIHNLHQSILFFFTFLVTVPALSLNEAAYVKTNIFGPTEHFVGMIFFYAKSVYCVVHLLIA